MISTNTSSTLPKLCPNTLYSSTNLATIPLKNDLKINLLMALFYSNRATRYAPNNFNQITLKFSLSVACGHVTNPVPLLSPLPINPPTCLQVYQPMKPPLPCLSLANSTSTAVQATCPGSSFQRSCNQQVLQRFRLWGEGVDEWMGQEDCP